MATKKALLDAAVKNTGALLQNLFNSNKGDESITSLLFRWNVIQADNAYGVVAFSDYNIERNRIFKALQDWITGLNEQQQQSLSLPESPLQETYKILSISRNKEEKQKMQEFFDQFSEFDAKTCLSDQIPDTTPFSILVFDNFELGTVTSPNQKSLSLEDKKHLAQMAKWVNQQSQKASSNLAPPGFIVHYGKYCYLLEGYNNCAAANFPFTLYGLIRQIIDFWQNSRTTSPSQEILIEDE